MNKIPLLASALLLSLLSASAGYFTGLGVKNSAAAKIGSAGSPDALRPSMPKQAPHSPASGNSPGPNIRNSDLGDLFALYESMTPEQLDQEITRWQSSINHRDGSIFDLNQKEKFALACLADKWGRTAPRQAMERLKSMGNLAGIIAPGIIQSWAKSNPEAAAAYLSEHREDIKRYDDYLGDIARELALSSPDRALQWASEISAEERSEIIPALMREIADTHPEQLQKYIDRLTAEDRQNYALCCSLAAKLARTDWDAANRWIDTLNGDRKHSARRSALEELCTVNPEKAMAEFDKLEKKTEGLYASLTNGLAEKDPILALQWLMKNAPEDIATDRTISIAGTYISYATPRIRQYAIDMADGPVKDSLLENLVKQDTSPGGGTLVNYEERLSLADHIKDPGKKENGVKEVLESWMQKDPKKAADWIKSSSLPEKFKQEAIKTIHFSRP